MAEKESEIEAPTILGKKVSPNVANAVSAFSASISAEGRRRERMGLSGAGFAAGFAEGMSPIIDYSKIMRGKADPGTVLGRVGAKAMEDNQRFKSDPLETDTEDDVVVDPLKLPVEKSKSPDPLGLMTPPTSGPEDKPEIKEAATTAVKAATGPKNPLDQLEPSDRQVVLTLISREGLSDEDLTIGVNYLVNNYGLKLAQEALKYAAEGKAK
jgi:hypothetical protein